MFQIDPAICRLNDERTISLCSGAITKQQFMQLIRQDDPFTLANGVLKLLSKEDWLKQRASYENSYKDYIAKTGGLHGNYVYDKIEEFKKVYPEIDKLYKEIKEIVEKENCKGCAKGQHTGKLVEFMLTLPIKGRNFDLLAEILKENPLAVTRLKGEQINRDDIKVPEAKHLMKKEIPLLPNGQEIKLDPNMEKQERQIKASLPPASILPDNPLGILRESCMDCVRKHLFRAAILFKENLQGYSSERGFIQMSMALAHLDEAAEEALKENPVLAQRIRNLRIQISGQTQYVKATI